MIDWMIFLNFINLKKEPILDQWNLKLKNIMKIKLMNMKKKKLIK